jgi:hypothetical protein
VPILFQLKTLFFTSLRPFSVSGGRLHLGNTPAYAASA